eukprot:7412471-Alexandrium_andersonii.AAC.1
MENPLDPFAPEFVPLGFRKDVNLKEKYLEEREAALLKDRLAMAEALGQPKDCLLYTSPSPRD